VTRLPLHLIALVCLWLTSISGAAVLSIDVNDATDSPTDTAPGFSDYELLDDTLNLPPFSIDINPSSGAALDDVHRATPADVGGLTLAPLFRDCIFAAGDNTANFYRVGLDATIGGLTPGKRYTITAWSFDSGSVGTRTSDWSVVGLGGPQFAVNNYTFDGSAPPAGDTSNRISVTTYANESGRVILRGRPNAQGTTAQVFLNGFTVDELPDAPVLATPVLALDFNDRAATGGINTQSGFSEFTLTGADGTTPTTTSRAFGTYTAVVTSVGGTLDDRPRTTPTNSGPFTDSLLVKDFVFTSSVSAGQGVDLRVQGLTANQTYLVELWSFDTGSPGARTSDWMVNGSTLWDDYVFNGSNSPATNDDCKMVGAFVASATGELLISGRVLAGAAAASVFLNSVRISDLAPAAVVDLGRPIISEFLAENSNGITDEDGDASDWIEIWNTTANAVDLSGWHLTDSATDHTKWTFPPGVTLASQARLRVWASGKDRKTNPAALHTSFALNKASGTYIGLFRPGGVTAAIEYTQLPGQREDISYGVSGTSNPLTFGYFQPPTPGAPNGTAVPGFVADTQFDLSRGFYSAPIAVHVTCATPNAAIHYTLDGSPPTEGSTPYPGAAGIPISKTTVLRVRAFLSPLQPSNIDTQTYIFLSQVQNQPANPGAPWPTTWGTDSEVGGTVPADYEMDPAVVTTTLPGYSVTDALAALPTFSVALTPSDFHSIGNGIYTNPKSVGDAWERACSIEFIDGTEGFHTSCGIRVHGNSSRRPFRMQKHSFRLAFRANYGDGRLNYKLFDDTSVRQFNRLILHAFFTDGWGLVSWDANRYRPNDSIYFRDPFMKKCWSDMGWPNISGRFVNVYINGLYWGVYELGERVDASFLADHLGGAGTDYDLLADFTALQAGTTTAWDQLFALVNSADLTQQANYENAASRVDLANFADYYLLHVHGDSEDWPHHNGYAYRNKAVGADNRWRFLVWDQEITFDSSVNVDRLSDNAQNTTTDKTAGRLYQRLKLSPEFRLLFADRAHKHLHNNGPLTLSKEQARWQAFADELDKGIVAESARWGDTADATPYGNAVTPPGKTVFTRETDWLPTVSSVKNTHFPNLHNTATAWSTITKLKNRGLYPATEAPTFSQFGGNVPANYQLSITGGTGTIYYTLNGNDPRQAFTSAAVGTAYTGPITLTQTGTVKARVLNGTVWSPATETVFIVGTAAKAGNLAVTEVNYNPATTQDEEFVELMNTGTESIDLTDVSFLGMTFVFADGTLLGAGERILVVRNQAAFVARYGAASRIAGQYTGALDDSGEELAVIDAGGADIVRFTFNDKAPWPTAPDGNGRSMVLRGPTLDPKIASNWRSSASAGGNPGGQDAVAFTGNPTADDDQDGLSALFEYSVGGSDSVPGDVPRPVLGTTSVDSASGTEWYLTIESRQNLAADGATLVAEFSSDLITWSSEPAKVVYMGETSDGNGVTTRRWRAADPISSASRQFLRVRPVQAQ
jgi:hypothetical protein